MSGQQNCPVEGTWYGRGTDITIALNKVKDKLNDYIVFAPQDFCDSVGDPSFQQPLARVPCPAQLNRQCLLFHNLHIDLLHIHLLIELGRKLGALEELCVHTGRHGRGSFPCVSLIRR